MKASQYTIAFIIGQVIFYFCIVVFIINAISKILFGASMRYAVKMLQVFQINEYLPLFHVNMPTFAIFFYQTISYTNWQLSDRKGLYQSIFGIKDLEPYNFNFEY